MRKDALTSFKKAIFVNNMLNAILMVINNGKYSVYKHCHDKTGGIYFTNH